VIQFRGEDGTLGKMGLATKLLTVLRTTEIIQLRGLPTKDEGLTFDTLLATLPVQKGVMQVDPLALESPSFMLVAKGQVDFVKETLDVTSDLYLLESVTGILDQVPVLSEAVELFKEAVDVRLQISGNLDDPEVVPRLVDTATSVVGTVTGAAGGLVKGVTGEAQRTLEGLLGGGGDTADERKEAETDGAEQPPSEPTG
jgi:hypothetical protein